MKLPGFLREWFDTMNPPVFFGAAALMIGIIIFGGLFTESAGIFFKEILSFISTYFGWFYVLSMTGFVVFVIWILFSRYGSIRLGGDDSRPDFSRLSWFSMLFAAGMGMGLVFWGVAEPLTHYMKPVTAEPGTPAALNESIRFTFFHWGFHPWAVYIIFGLAMAYFHYRRGLPLAPRSMLYMIIGERYKGIIGHIVDVICVAGTTLGVATSLGLGAMQINSGFKELIGISYGTDVQVIIIVVITLIATTSTVTGVGKGIKALSLTNMVLAFALLLFVIVAGPTLYQLKTLISGFGDYIQNLPGMSLWIDNRKDSSWQASWTLFYWGWWISWCPFVGIFVARISKGRTIREFVFFVFLIPTIVTFIWLSAFGGTALSIEILGNGGIWDVVQKNVSMSLNTMLSHLPFPYITQWLGLILIIIFFITSSDSGSFVDDMIASGGNPDPSVAQRIFWGFCEGGIAGVLLLAGGLQALQSASIASGLPQSIIVILGAYGLVKALKADHKSSAKELKEK